MIYGNPKQIPDGRYYLKVLTDENKRITAQINNTTLLTKFDNDDDVTITLDSVSHDKIVNFDDGNILAAKEHSEKWFGKELSPKTIETAYSSSVIDGNMNVGKSKPVAFTHDKKPVDINTITENTLCDIILEFSGIWFMKKTFGPVWRITQLRMKKPAPKQIEYMFQDEDESSADEEDPF